MAKYPTLALKPVDFDTFGRALKFQASARYGMITLYGDPKPDKAEAITSLRDVAASYQSSATAIADYIMSAAGAKKCNSLVHNNRF